MKQKILGRPFNIRKVKELDGDTVGEVHYRDQEILLVETSADCMDRTCWHEIVHIFDEFMRIKDDGNKLSENEVARLSYAISTHLREIKR